MSRFRVATVMLVLSFALIGPVFGQGLGSIFPTDASKGCGALRPLTAQEAFEHRQQVCDSLQDWGIYWLADGAAMGGPGYKCSIFKKWKGQAGQVLCVPGPAPALVGKDLVARFAPELRFDRAAQGYPMSPQPFFDKLTKDKDGNPVNMPGSDPLGVENTSSSTLQSGTIPTYYQVRAVGKQVRIRYWWFYGYQDPCFAGKGKHNGDWENVIVILREDRNAVAAVVYYQHGGWYTRIAVPRDAPCTPGGTGRCAGSSGFRSDGEHPVVYVGKVSHGSFHDDNAAGPAGAGQCAYYGDFRNPKSDADYLRTWQDLVDLDEYGEPWMLKDYWSAHSVAGGYPTGEFASWVWGPDGISNHPTQNPPPSKLAACEGSPTYKVDDAGCYKSECLAGDDEASENCLKECKPGYTNQGLTCWKSAFHLYGRLQGDHWYRYDYTLPASDVGLSRLRQAVGGSEAEWDLP
jgi:hypothetical protein